MADLVNTHRLLPLFFALQLLANFLHCTSHSVGTIVWAAKAKEAITRSHQLPMDPTPPVCDHEFGCICRGAIVAQAISTDEFAPSQMSAILVTDNSSILVGRPFNGIDGNSLLNRLPLPIPETAREMRARLASFLI